VQRLPSWRGGRVSIVGWPELHTYRVGQNHIYMAYIRYFGREINRFTVIYSVYIYMVLANPTHIGTLVRYTV